MTPEFKSYLTKVAGVVVSIVVVALSGYAFGRYVQPPKVEIKEVTVEKEVVRTEIQIVEKKVYVKATDVDTRTETVVVKQPNGTETTTIVVVDKSKINEASSQESTAVKVVEKEVIKVVEKESTTEVRKDYHLRVDVGAGARFVGQLTPVLQIGVGAERRIVGPIFAGIWANTTLNLLSPGTPPYTVTGGVSLGMEF